MAEVGVALLEVGDEGVEEVLSNLSAGHFGGVGSSKSFWWSGGGLALGVGVV